ncbi:MAG: hypothetical protein GXP39_08095 [Chloroflexi bacterium]|nr:hypothetical protein [Chloroflexota bacterium]
MRRRKRLSAAIHALAQMTIRNQQHILARAWAWLADQLVRRPALPPAAVWERPSDPEMAARFDRWLATGERQWVFIAC